MVSRSNLREVFFVTFGTTVLLGALAGLTLFLGLPFAKLKGLSSDTRTFLNSLAIGVLFFLFFDVLSQALSPVEALVVVKNPEFVTYLLVFVVGVGFGLLGLIYYERWILKGKKASPRTLAFMIALGIGLHNFSEGLAIGSSSRAGLIALALTLIVGFGLHNITEGFGIVSPLTESNPSWGFLLGLGLLGGGPTFLGTVIGYGAKDPLLSVLFLSLAAGALVYIIGELQAMARKLGSPGVYGWGLLLGFTAAILTDLILTAAGA